MIQVQVRMPENMVKEMDKWVNEGKFKSRSDAVKSIINFYEEKEKTMNFFKMLVRRSKEVKENPDILIPLEESDEI